jgi:hypothetical protein
MLLAAYGTTQLTAGDFSLALLAVGGIGMLSVPFFLRMSPDAGAEVSGRAPTASMVGKLPGSP